MLRLARKNILFIIIVLIAALLRFSFLSTTPPSLSHDEVAIGYNAWSILKTGKDEYGTFMPVLFRSFDEYKLPGYIYFTTLAEFFFGLTPFAVRFTSAFLGTLTVGVLYFIVKEIIGADKNKRTLNSGKFSLSHLKEKIGNLLALRSLSEGGRLEIPILTMLMLAISPWHINFSRAAFESNGSLFFITLGLLLLLVARRKPKYYLLAAISFSLSFSFYYTARVLVPVLIIGFLIIYKDNVRKHLKILLLSFFAGLLLFLPLIIQPTNTGTARINQVSIFENSDLKKIAESYALIKLEHPNPINRAIYNTRMIYIMQFIDNYVKNFNLDFFFTNGSGPMGLLYVWELPIFFYGIYKTLLLREREKWFMLIWFFATPIVGGLTVGQPNALRTLPNALPAAFFTALGLVSILKVLSQKKYALIASSLLSLCILFFFLRFLSIYFIYNPPRVASEWGDGHRQMAEFVKQNMNRYDNIFVTGNYWRPYIYLAFYTKYPPDKFQKYGSRYKLKNITFGTAGWDTGDQLRFSDTNLSLLVKNKTLFILSPDDFAGQQALRTDDKVPYQMNVIKEINGKFVYPAFYAIVLQ